MTILNIKERNKEIQRKRKMTYFIEATQEIMENEGVDKVTIRKVADLAGYNSATIYNYFKSLDHMIAFASIQYLEEYNKEFIEGIKNKTNELEKFILEWQIFLKNAFNHPKAFEYVFFSGDENIEDMMKEYYEIFPVESELEESYRILKLGSLENRNKTCLQEISKAGYIDEKDINIVNEITICVAHEYISIAARKNEKFDSLKYIEKFVSCINYIINKA